MEEISIPFASILIVVIAITSLFIFRKEYLKLKTVSEAESDTDALEYVLTHYEKQIQRVHGSHVSAEDRKEELREYIKDKSSAIKFVDICKYILALSFIVLLVMQLAFGIFSLVNGVFIIIACLSATIFSFILTWNQRRIVNLLRGVLERNT